MYDTPNRRLNILTREWVLVSPQRANRPWNGQVETAAQEIIPQYETTCYLCPGNERVSGQRNPDYSGTFVFDNDFSSLLPGKPQKQVSDEKEVGPDSLLQSVEESGQCKVVCFSPRHDLTMPQLSLDEAVNVINTWSDQTEKLMQLPEIAYVQVFENKGAIMGCSNPHPHSQIWAQSSIPTEPAKELISQSDYFNANQSALLLDYLHKEQALGERIVTENQYFSALVPFWAIWPFEVLVISHRAVSSLPDLNQNERRGLAEILQKVTAKYDNLFGISFPYSMGFHQAPNDDHQHPEWVLHAHYYPPLLRSATVKKFMVGYELLCMPQRDLTAEVAAARLREMPDTLSRKI